VNEPPTVATENAFGPAGLGSANEICADVGILQMQPTSIATRRRQLEVRRPSLRTLLVLVLPFFGTIAINVATGAIPEWMRPWLWLAWPAAGVLAVLQIWIHIRANRIGPQTQAFDEALLDQASNRLAADVRLQWTDEAALRGVASPGPLQLAWSSTARPVASPASAVLGVANLPRNARLRSAGNLANLAARFRELPSGQLVVLGKPGSGKTVFALLLTLDLLRHARADDPVPVLVSLSTWNPDTMHLRSWMAARLVEDYPYLAYAETYGTHAAGRLLSTGRVMPVLDGFDELPEATQPAALAALDRAAADGSPFVLTCRTAEYVATIEDHGRPLARAAVVEIEDVLPSQVATFLASSGSLSTLWEPVLQRLAASPESPLAQAFRTPLMVSLAISAYESSGSAPAELLDAARFPDQQAVERSLLQSFVPAAYKHYPPAPAEFPEPQLRRYRPTDAQRWLGFLAIRMTLRGQPDLAWWELRSSFRRPRAAIAMLGGAAVGIPLLALGLAASLLSGLPTWPAGKIWAALAADVYLTFPPAIVTGIAVGLTKPQPPNRAALGIRGAASGFRSWLRTRWISILGAIIVTIGFVVIAKTITVAAHALDVVAAVPAPIALIVGVVVLPSLIANRLTRRPLSAEAATAPTDVLRSDRRAAALRGVVSALATSIGVGSLLLFASDKATASVLVVGVSLMAGCIGALTTAWGNFQLVRLWYGIRGTLPFFLIRFLSDAHHRGVLRQSGASYQFRHLRLQEYLAQLSLAQPATARHPSPRE
jgi:hypothetical protein